MYQDKPAKITIKRGKREMELTPLDFTRILLSVRKVLDELKLTEDRNMTDVLQREGYRELEKKLSDLL